MTSKEKVSNFINIFILQASDGKRDEFTNYLENNGLVENLCDVLISLYEEPDQPKFPTEYIKANLKSSNAGENEILIQNNKIKEENKKLNQKIIELERSIERVKKLIEEKQSQA